MDALFAQLMQAGSSAPRVRELLARPDLDEVVMLGVLRRPVPVRFIGVGEKPEDLRAFRAAEFVEAAFA